MVLVLGVGALQFKWFDEYYMIPQINPSLIRHNNTYEHDSNQLFLVYSIPSSVVVAL